MKAMGLSEIRDLEVVQEALSDAIYHVQIERSSFTRPNELDHDERYLDEVASWKRRLREYGRMRNKITRMLRK